MGTQIRRLTTPHAWAPRAVQADSGVWKLEAHHVVSKAWLQLSERILKASSTRGQCMCLAFSAKDRSSPEALACCGRPNPNPSPTMNQTLHRNLSLSRYLTLQLSCLLARALTSVLEGVHENRVALALATSLDRTLTLAKAISPVDPITTSENTRRLWPISGTG